MNQMLEIIIAQCRIKVIETVRPNGILIAQITPRGGRISEYIIHSSIRQLGLGKMQS
jgi:hypothetical protein